jgi:hypothetical protein
LLLFLCHPFTLAFPRQQAAASSGCVVHTLAGRPAGNCTLCSTGSCVQTLAPAAVCWALGPVCHHVWLFTHRCVFLSGYTTVAAMPATEGPWRGSCGVLPVRTLQSRCVVQPEGSAVLRQCRLCHWPARRQGRQCRSCHWPARQAARVQCCAYVAGSCCMLGGVRQLLPVNLLSWLCCVVRSYFVCGEPMLTEGRSTSGVGATETLPLELLRLYLQLVQLLQDLLGK